MSNSLPKTHVPLYQSEKKLKMKLNGTERQKLEIRRVGKGINCVQDYERYKYNKNECQCSL